MKKRITIAIAVILLIAITAAVSLNVYRSSESYRREKASHTLTNGSSQIEEGTLKSYSQNLDGTWSCDGYTYKYKLEITGRTENAAADSTFVYLSNLEKITFDQAWKAAGLSSNTDDYFDVNDAVLVAWRMES